MSFTGTPHSGPLSAQDFYTQALNESDAGKRRRLFADARQSNPGSYQIWVKAAEVEEHWGADQTKLKDLLVRGVTVFKNPAGSGCTQDHDHSQHGFAGGAIDKNTWLTQATVAENNGKSKTAAALHEAVGEVL
ncbi:hypothetical protein BGZ80_009843 [Entomortierella chlamydospora]|uniref:Uncharacterized protein n=1 Tax=Entomortierella chlamydospora TaxID=101097 RepID=A0A9P6MWL6_9FUNG|nr:hypothetical protein BGZ79_001927 [Entomortierella chlamydospora]KAG0015471.1 hypothetical protein BGZ80_009843 [Entomortierella chlamydospora]